MRLLYTLFTFAVGGYGLFYLADKYPDLRNKAEEFIDFRTTNALQMQYGYEELIHIHQATLIKERGTRFLDPELTFYPHLLLEVKYNENNKTKEGHILWDLIDGEMILDTKDWTKTHGFADCILANTQPHEYQILQALLANGGQADSTTLANNLQLELPIFEIITRSCLKKNLIIPCSAKTFRIHLEKPQLPSLPSTKFHEQLIIKSHKRVQRAKGHFSPSKIEKIARVAFGENFSIRISTEIYLPVYRISVQNPSGAVQTALFNALTGKPLPQVAFYQ